MSRRGYQFASEDDRFNCKFYFKIGACRHGDRCSRQHIRPVLSATLMIPNLYLPPAAELPTGGRLSSQDLQEHFEDFYEDIYDEVKKYGKVIELVVLQNLGDHMFGNTYIKFAEEEAARACMQAINGRYYCGRQIQSTFNPVASFRDARCKSFEQHGQCQRGGYCNFMHLRRAPRWIERKIRENRERAIRDARRAAHRDVPAYYFTQRTTSPERRRTVARWNRDLEDRERRHRERDPEGYEREQAEKQARREQMSTVGMVAPMDTSSEMAKENNYDASALDNSVTGGRGQMGYASGSHYPVARVSAPQVSSAGGR
ncbi:MAG: hypothetical protein MHM6MM_007797 [Cercozoa sp. M6MM]